jgi:hypothetical protein
LIVCNKCEAEKPLTDFYPKTSKCKECTKAAVRLNRQLKSEYYLEYDRNRFNKVERNLQVVERNKTKYHSNPEYKEKVLSTKKGWADRNPLKRKAQYSATNAVRGGKLERKTSCEHCGTEDKKLHKHHWSYLEEHWLDVVWLCPKCHGTEHKRLNEIGRDPDSILI